MLKETYVRLMDLSEQIEADCGFTELRVYGVNITSDGEYRLVCRIEDDFQADAPDSYKQYNGYKDILVSEYFEILTRIPSRRVRELRFIAAKVNALSTNIDKLTDAAGLSFLADILAQAEHGNLLLEQAEGEY